MHVCMCIPLCMICDTYVYTMQILLYIQLVFVSESFCHHIFYSKMRAKLGLKPLQVDDGGNKENGIIQQHNVYVHTHYQEFIRMEGRESI